MSRQDPRDWLEAEGVRLRDWSVGNHRSTCPRCSASRRKNKRQECLSVTIRADSILYCCQHCAWSGLAGGRQSADGDRRPPPPPKKVEYRDPPAVDVDPLGREALAFFEKRGISAETCRIHDVGQVFRWMPPPVDAKTTALVFPYTRAGKLVNRKYRALGQKAFIQDPKTRRTLFNADGALGAEVVAIVEGEMDVLALTQAGVWPAVSLPDGASKAGNAARLEILKDSGLVASSAKIIVAGDHDRPGMAMRADIVDLFGRERCWAVEWPANSDVICKDAGDCLVECGADAVKECVQLAKSCIDGRV